MLRLGAGIWEQASGDLQYSLCLFQPLCLVFLSEVTYSHGVHPSPPLDLTTPKTLPFARQPLTTPAGGTTDFIFCRRTGASTPMPQAARPGSPPKHKGLPLWLTWDVEEGRLQVAWQQALPATWADADKDGKQLLAGGKLALDALVS